MEITFEDPAPPEAFDSGIGESNENSTTTTPTSTSSKRDKEPRSSATKKRDKTAARDKPAPTREQPRRAVKAEPMEEEEEEAPSTSHQTHVGFPLEMAPIDGRLAEFMEFEDEPEWPDEYDVRVITRKFFKTFRFPIESGVDWA